MDEGWVYLERAVDLGSDRGGNNGVGCRGGLLEMLGG